MELTSVTSAVAGIIRITGPNSVYSKHAQEAIEERVIPKAVTINRVQGVVKSLRQALQAGYIKTLQELIHGDLFSDFLEMADHLLNEGYKDAAAVIGGSSLEAHLRQLCLKNNIDLEVSTSSGTRRKKAEQLNSDLAAAKIYSKLDHKNVTSWLDLRNKAAHGEYSEYTDDQVKLFLASIQDFVTRHPA